MQERPCGATEKALCKGGVSREKPSFQASKLPNFLTSFWRREVGRGRVHVRLALAHQLFCKSRVVVVHLFPKILLYSKQT